MATLCQKCGVTGYSELLNYCSRCHTSVEHWYCMDKLPKQFKAQVHWLCEKCKQRVPKLASHDRPNFDRGRNKSKPEYRGMKYKFRTQRIKFKHQQINHDAKFFTTLKKSKNAVTNGSVVKVASRCAVSAGQPSGFNVMSVNNKSASCARLQQNEVKDAVHPSTVCSEDKKVQKPRRKLILADEDQLDKDDQSDFGYVLREVDNSENDEDKKVNRRRRRLILADEDQLDKEDLSNSTDQNVLNKSMHQANEPLLSVPSSQYARDFSTTPSSHTSSPNTFICSSGFDSVEAPEQPVYIPARPIVNHSWSGSFDIQNVKYGPVTAHLSEKACEKVCNGAKILPPVLFAEKLSRLDTWPASFKTSPPTDDNIALYFFPEDARVESVHDQLLEDVTNKDLMLKVKVDNAELLVFSSFVLPAESHKFLGKYYLWGVFKGRKDPTPSTPANCFPKLGEIQEKPVMENMDLVEEEVEVEAHDTESIHVSLEGNDGSLFPTLDLFPLREEDMAITARVGKTDRLDLELGLGCVGAGDVYCERNFRSISHPSFDSTIF